MEAVSTEQIRQEFSATIFDKRWNLLFFYNEDPKTKNKHLAEVIEGYKFGSMNGSD